MDFYQLLTFLQTLSPYVQYVLMGLGTLVILAGVYVKLTPNTNDDAFLLSLEEKPIIGDLLKALMRFSPIERAESAEAKKADKK